MLRPGLKGRGWLKTHRFPLLVIGSFLLPIIIINPFREMLSQDDSWAYARMVKHLLAAGEYRIDAWSAANMPVQIYIAAASSKLFGYSLTVLRCTTLSLFVVAVASFYLLLRELSHSQVVSALCSMALAASPLVLTLAFSFMSDVQFLGWLLLSVWLYVRGLRRASLLTIFCGSIAAGLAIGTRQFGIALIVAFLAAQLSGHSYARNRVWGLIAGLAVPTAAAAAQIYVGLRQPNFTQAYRMTELHMFWSNPATALMAEAAWRVVVLLQYAGMSLMPLLPILLSRSQIRRRRDYATILFACTIVALGLSVGSSLTARPEAQHRGFWEPLELYWLLPTHLGRMHWAMRLLDIAGILGAGCLVLLLSRVFRPPHAPDPARILIGVTAAVLVLLHLFYVQLNDTYVTALIPFALLASASWVDSDKPSSLVLAGVMACILASSATCLWVRAEYSRQQAEWKSADLLVDRGVQPQDIAAPLHWAEYHGAFDEWIRAGAPGFDPHGPSDRGRDALHDPFYAWLTQRSSNAGYRLVDAAESYDISVWEPIRTVPYRTARFADHEIRTLRRR